MMQKLTADALGISSQEVLVASTGVIGKQLPMEKIKNGIKDSVSAMDADGGDDAARAILTTDLVEKKAAVKVITGDGKEIIIGGIAKGSGMIEPNMATMLAFIGTDAVLDKDLLESILKESNEKSFNSISVDGCQSTNDSAFLMANGKSGIKIEKSGSDYEKFFHGLTIVMQLLAKKIVMDGEGATKFIEIKVDGAPDGQQAKNAAMKIANSNLFKTAVFGQDLNWGRINAALGASGTIFDPDKIDIYVNDKMIVKNGIGIDIEKDEAESILKPKDIIIEVNLNSGEISWTVWTSDLSFDYIKINALYHN
jgi:glutamate N-acetyltransferase/amino-acid N-acetyltransferase